MARRTTLWILLLLMMLVSSAVLASELTCAYMLRDPVKEMSNIASDKDDKDSDAATDGEVLSDNKTMRCLKTTDFCYALWQEDPQNKSLTCMLAQGCWESSGKFDCGEFECISNKKPPKALNNSKFCCCSGSLCNINVTDVYVPTSDEPEPIQPAIPSEKSSAGVSSMAINTLAILFSFIILTGVAFLAFRWWAGVRKPSPDALHLMESPPPHTSTPSFDLSSLKLQEVIGRGRYGAVWRANLNDRDVAVKVFQPQHRQYYLNEKDIYTLPYLEHSSLLRFLGSDERLNVDGRTEYMLLLSYNHLGCLQDYLRNQTIDWNTLCRMSQSIAKGLAHLHTDIRKGDLMKPCVAHRDLNTRNVLVKSDLSCAICDMGFAMKIAGSKYYSQNGEEQQAETTSLTDVGTLRYMAPEVLEGAVNLRDCESSLKQIDIYALGLVLWEIMTRCSDLYQGLEVPEYRLPFEAEIGLHPTFEEMQVLISRKKARPLFSEVWKDSNQAMRTLKETIEDCWDQDAEARLTAMCVEERLQELPVLWDRHRASMNVTGVSPTINPTSSSQVSGTRNPSFIGNGILPSANGPGINTLTTPPCLMVNGNLEVPDRNGNIPGVLSLADCRGPRTAYHQNRESSASEATVETTVTMSPSEPPPSAPLLPPVEADREKNANTQQNSLRPNNLPPLQPYQGRNPCIERNMIMEPLEEVSVSGNTILEKGAKYKNGSSNVLQPNHRDVDIVDLHAFDVLQLADNMESNSLVSNDVLNQSTRTCNPIPYVQNAVHGPIPTRPKQPNVPGNGQHYDKKPPKKGPFGGRFDKKKVPGEQKKNKDWGFKSFLDRKRSGKCSNSNTIDESNLAVHPRIHRENTDNASVNNNRHQSALEDAQTLAKSNLALRSDESAEMVPTEVCLLLQNGSDMQQVVTRPTNGLYRSIENGYLANGACHTGATEVGVAKLAATSLPNGQAPVIKCRSAGASGYANNSGLVDCHSESDLLGPNKTRSRLKRPNTLPLNGHGFADPPAICEEKPVIQNRKLRASHDGSQFEKAALLNDYEAANVIKEDADFNIETPRVKIVKRVKTPFEIKPGRFSLCDDRMMFQSINNSLEQGDSKLHRARTSASVPTNMNSACSQSTEDALQKAQMHTKRDQPPAKLSEAQGSKLGKNGISVPNGTVSSLWSDTDYSAKLAADTNGFYRVSYL